MGEKGKQKLRLGMVVDYDENRPKAQFSHLKTLQMALLEVSQTRVSGLKFFAIQRQCFKIRKLF